ncbi:MAG: OmpH family outer membrane protein [Chlamydiota bacterium]|nr:OmpH family outer membrane protein [Chlamydiota bacterium]
MKKYSKLNTILFSTLSALVLCSAVPEQLSAAGNGELHIGVINFKECVEKSKMGKQEQTSFEALKKQAEQMLQSKEKEMSEIASKLDDQDYLDSLSADAEAELKHKFRTLNQQLAQNQQQLYQTLSQANFKIVQKLTDKVNEAAEKVADKMKLDMILNEDACFFFTESLDITDETVKTLDSMLENSNS